MLHFLTELFEDNCGYSALNTTRSALSTFIVLPGNISVGNHPLVTRFMKGVFQSRPTFPKYTEIWDVKVVFLFENSEPCCKIVSKGLDLQGYNDIDVVIGSKDPNNPVVGFERYDYV